MLDSNPLKVMYNKDFFVTGYGRQAWISTSLKGVWSFVFAERAKQRTKWVLLGMDDGCLMSMR